MTPSPRSSMSGLARLDAAARLILRDPELARDAVQEALIRAWRDLPGLRDPERFDAWLHRLLVNACLDLVRRRKRRVIEVELTADRRAGRARRGGRPRRPPAARPGASRRLRPGPSRGRRPALPARDAAAGGGADPGHPPRDGQVTAALRARRDAHHRDRLDPTPSRPSSQEGSSHDLDRDASSRTCRRSSSISYLDRTPDYRDDLFQQTARVRQRPAWMFPERWLPMDIADRAGPGAALPLRVARLSSRSSACSSPRAAAVRRARNTQLPAPFGPAANGLDRLRSGRRHLHRRPGDRRRPAAIVDGPETDSWPVLLARRHQRSPSCARLRHGAKLDPVRSRRRRQSSLDAGSRRADRDDDHVSRELGAVTAVHTSVR